MPAEKRPYMLDETSVFPSTSTTARSSPKPGGGSHESLQQAANEAKDYTVCDQCRLKKIRCGRERPACSNCTRVGVECEWSGFGKKPNQTIMLSHTVMGLGTRVDQLEKTISGIQNTLAKLDPELCVTSLLTPAPVQPVSFHRASTSTSQSTSPSLSSSPRSRKAALPPGHFHLVHGADGLQQYVGPTSLESLIQNFNQSVLVPLCLPHSGNDATSMQMLDAVEKLKGLASQGEVVDFLHDGSPPTSPPLVILEAMIDPYFDNINAHAPIWSKGYFRKRVEKFRESGDDLRHRGDIVCFNSLVLLTLTAKLLRAAAREAQSGSSRPGGKSIDLDLNKSFLANAMRAIQNIEVLLTPRLINVQALLSLYLVAQTHWGSQRASLLLNLAATAARSIGLHQWEPSQAQLSPEEAQERQQVFSCLYILDKSRCWTDGRPPNVQMHTPDIWLSSTEPRGQHRPKLAARAKLAYLEEQVYLELYSDSLGSRSSEHIDLIIANLSHELQQCWLDYGAGKQDEVHHVSDVASVDLEFNIATQAMRLLLCWPQNKKAQVDDQLVSSASSCLALAQQLWTKDCGLGNYSSVIRIMAAYTPLSFFQLCRFAVLSKLDDSNKRLLGSFIKTIQAIASLEETNVVIKKLAKFGEIILHLLRVPSGMPSNEAAGPMTRIPTFTPSYQDSNTDLLEQHNSTPGFFMEPGDPMTNRSESFSPTTRFGRTTPFHRYSLRDQPEPAGLMDHSSLPDFGFLMDDENTQFSLQHWALGNARAFSKGV